jgi:hypothetical protein
MLILSISYWDLLKCLYFADASERGDRGVEGGPKTGKREVYFMDNSNVLINLLSNCINLISVLFPPKVKSESEPAPEPNWLPPSLMSKCKDEKMLNTPN